MENFWDFKIWETFCLYAVLLGSLLAGNMIKKGIPFLRASLIPTSVLGGCILIVIAAIFKGVTGQVMFDTPIFGGNGTAKLEVLTYHALALGFIASTLKSAKGKINKKRGEEIFNTGVTTVATYLLQAIIGLGITLIVSLFVSGFFKAAGVLLPFGYGQGTGQALNYGTIYETEFGFEGGKSFGLTIAALGFLSASIGGVIHLNIMKKKGKFKNIKSWEESENKEIIQSDNEIPMQESIDKFTVQAALIAVTYFLAYSIIYVLGRILPGMKSVIYGFNFLLGVISAVIVKAVLNFLMKKSVVKKEYRNDFLLTRASNFFFDIMIVSGIAAIRLDMLEKYWGIILILAVACTILTYAYNRYVAKKLFAEYSEEQFLMMYGMLTGTASTGIILLREIDGNFKTPAADNMVYQNFPAIFFGFPMMFLATLVPKMPILTFIIFILFFAGMNIILFRKYIFKKRRK